MKLAMNQQEIDAGVRKYVESLGVNVTGQDVRVIYTMGRKGSGLSAEVHIGAVEIPGFTDNKSDEVKSAVKQEKVETKDEVKTEAKQPEVVEAATTTAEPEADVPAVEEEAVEATSTTNLFGDD